MDDCNRQKGDRRSLPSRQMHEAIDQCVAERQADHLRVTAQLIDAASGGHPWAESWDRPTADIFAVQAEIAQKIGAALAGFRGVVQETGRIAGLRKRPESLTACDLHLQATDARRESTRESAARSLRLLQQATAEDPGFARMDRPVVGLRGGRPLA